MRHFWTIEVRLVVDTNVRVAAELASSKETSAAAQLLRLIQRKVYERASGKAGEKRQRVVVVWLRSLEMQNELREQLAKRGFRSSWVLSILQETAMFSELVTVEERDISNLRKQAPLEAHDDLHVIACAIKGKATHIVTYDKRHLLTPEAKRFMRRYGIKVVTPAEMLAELRRLGDP
jgi:predicted nucleic acid-binding protein